MILPIGTSGFGGDAEDDRSVSEDDQIHSPKHLATALYDAGLVQVKARENFNSDDINRNNAIGSIEKKIVRHDP